MRHSDARCSFCRKSVQKVGPLIEGPKSVYICGDCIELCWTIIEQERWRTNTPLQAPALEQLREMFGVFFKQIPVAANTLIAAVHDHLQAVVHNRSTPKFLILLVGPSESSRLFAARAIAQSLGGPFAAGDEQTVVSSSSSFNSGSLLFHLLEASEFDVAAANNGVVYARGLHERSAQNALLKLIDAESKSGFPAQLDFKTEAMLFICGARADQLGEIRPDHREQFEEPIKSEELIAWGMIPEFVDRLRLALWWNPLDEEALICIVSNGEIKL